MVLVQCEVARGRLRSGQEVEEHGGQAQVDGDD